MIDQDTAAAAAFYREVRKFAEFATGWQTNVIFHETLPDESSDFTLVSQRVYGRRDEYLCVMAVAGIDTVDQSIPAGRRLNFPNEEKLIEIKRRVGFESQTDLRENFAPVWKED